MAAFLKEHDIENFPNKIFCGFPWVETSTAGRVYDLCVLLYDGSTRRLTESLEICH